MLSTLWHIGEYAKEVATVATRSTDKIIGTENEKILEATSINHNKLQLAAYGLLGTVFYDMAQPPKQKNQREKIRKTSTQFMLLTDLIDDIIDSPNVSIEEKTAILDRSMDTLFGYRTHFPQSPEEDLGFQYANQLYRELIKYDTSGKLESLFRGFIPEIKEQFTTTDPQRALQIHKKTGASCLEIGALLTELINNQHIPEIRTAARKLGEYGQLIDIASEIDDDLQEGTNTYATLTLQKKGDTHQVRREIIRNLQQCAQQSFIEGSSFVPQNQQPRYNALKIIIDTKYALQTRGLKKIITPDKTIIQGNIKIGKISPTSQI